MKNSNKKTVIVTVLVTILAIASIGGLLYAGFVFGKEYQSGIDKEVSTQVKDLASVVTAKK